MLWDPTVTTSLTDLVRSALEHPDVDKSMANPFAECLLRDVFEVQMIFSNSYMDSWEALVLHYKYLNPCAILVSI